MWAQTRWVEESRIIFLLPTAETEKQAYRISDWVPTSWCNDVTAPTLAFQPLGEMPPPFYEEIPSPADTQPKTSSSATSESEEDDVGNYMEIEPHNAWEIEQQPITDQEYLCEPELILLSDTSSREPQSPGRNRSVTSENLY